MGSVNSAGVYEYDSGDGAPTADVLNLQSAALTAKFQGLDALETYIPLLTAPSTNPNLGSGTNFEQSGRYWVGSGGMVSVQVILRFGNTGVSEGSGNYTISLPVPVDTTFHLVQNITGASDALGQAILRDNSNNSASTIGAVYAINANSVRIVTPGQGMVSHNSPWVWDTWDAISLTLSYKGDFS